MAASGESREHAERTDPRQGGGGGRGEAVVVRETDQPRHRPVVVAALPAAEAERAQPVRVGQGTQEGVPQRLGLGSRRHGQHHLHVPQPRSPPERGPEARPVRVHPVGLPLLGGGPVGVDRDVLQMRQVVHPRRQGTQQGLGVRPAPHVDAEGEGAQVGGQVPQGHSHLLARLRREAPKDQALQPHEAVQRRQRSAQTVDDERVQVAQRRAAGDPRLLQEPPQDVLVQHLAPRYLQAVEAGGQMGQPLDQEGLRREVHHRHRQAHARRGEVRRDEAEDVGAAGVQCQRVDDARGRLLQPGEAGPHVRAPLLHRRPPPSHVAVPQEAPEPAAGHREAWGHEGAAPVVDGRGQAVRHQAQHVVRHAQQHVCLRVGVVGEGGGGWGWQRIRDDLPCSERPARKGGRGDQKE